MTAAPAIGEPVLATVVHIHKLLGRVYMLLVAPVHKRIVPAMLGRYRAGDAG